MNGKVLGGLLVMGFLITSTQTWAMSGRGSVVSGRRGQTSAGRNSVLSGKKGQTSEGRNKVKGGGKTNGGNNGNGNGNGHGGGGGAGQQARKWPLPAAVEIKDLDTALFDQVKGKLELSDKQVENIDKAIDEIKAKRERLLQEQTNARNTYNQAASQDEIRTAAGNVADAARHCSSFNARFLFNQRLRLFLTTEQKGKCAFL